MILKRRKSFCLVEVEVHPLSVPFASLRIPLLSRPEGTFSQFQISLTVTVMPTM